MVFYFANQCITLFSKCAIALLITHIAFLLNLNIVWRSSSNRVIGISTTPILKWLDHRFMKMLTRTYFDIYQLNHIKLDKTVNVVLQNNFSLSSWVKNKRYHADNLPKKYQQNRSYSLKIDAHDSKEVSNNRLEPQLKFIVQSH